MDFHDRLEAAKAASLGHLLLKAARLYDERARERVAARAPEAPTLGPSHTALFPHIDLDGTRLTTLADHVGTSKQAVGALVDDLEAIGMVERTPDPTDGRAKLVRFTAGGRERLLEGLAIFGEVEAALAPALGKGLEDLKAALRTIIDVLE